MTQIDALKSNAIEIFCNLLTLNSTSNNSSIFQFLRSEEQRKNNYIFLRNLTQHMLYSNQQGLKVSVCEFLKDLIGQEQQELKQMFNTAILEEVSQRLILFLSELEPEEFTDTVKKLGGKDDASAHLEESKNCPQPAPHPGTTQATPQDEALVKHLEQSRCLVLQFFTKLIQDSTFPTNVRVFFVKNQVFNKIADLRRFNSRQVNIEIVKFFKAIIQSKDRQSILCVIKNNIFDGIMRIFLDNPNKRNLLNSVILSLFELIANQMHTDTLNQLLLFLVKRGYSESVFFNPLYQGDFHMIESQLRDVMDTLSEQDSKQRSDRDS